MNLSCSGILIATTASLLITGSVYGETIRIPDGTEIHYRKSGSGPNTIVLVPGWTMSSEVFERQLEYVKGSQVFTVIAMDPRGQGDSSKPSNGNFYEQHGRDLHDFVRGLGLKKFVLAGWSNGNFDTLSYIHQFGAAKVSGFAMIDGSPIGTEKGEDTKLAWFRRDDSDSYRRSVTQGVLLSRKQFDKEFAEWMVDKPSDSYLKWIGSISSKTSDEVAALTNESSAYQDYTDDLQGLDDHIPLLFVSSEERSASVSAWATKHAPNAQRVSFGRHLMFWEYSDRFNEVFFKFALMALKN